MDLSRETTFVNIISGPKTHIIHNTAQENQMSGTNVITSYRGKAGVSCKKLISQEQGVERGTVNEEEEAAAAALEQMNGQANANYPFVTTTETYTKHREPF